MCKRVNALTVLFVALMLLLAACSGGGGSDEGSPDSAAPGGQVYTMSISTGGTTGMYYTTHAPICDYINANSATIRIVPSTSGGSTENVSNVLNGVSDIGCVYNNEMMEAYARNDQARFIGPTTMVSPLQFVVRADSGITSLEDLRGKVVHLGAAGSGARNWAAEFFEWVGLIGEVTEVPLGHEEIVSALGDGDVDMMTVGGLAPSARVTEAAMSYDIVLLDLTDYLEAFIADYPYFETYIVAAGTYKSLEEDIQSFGLATSLICMADLDYDVLYEYMSWYYGPEAQAAALTSNPVGPDHDPADPLANMTIPIHPAARDFWTEKGFTVPEL